ncbi:MAG: aminotransferase class IV [Anaerolineae bacterium]
MHDIVHHNGQLLPLRNVRLSPGQSGLFSGWGLFTTVRVYDGQPFAFDRHLRRLRLDARRTDTPFAFADDDLLEALLQVVEANGVPNCSARLYFTNNTVGPWHGTEPLPATDLLVCTADLPTHRSPARLTVVDSARHAGHPLAGVKVLSWLGNSWVTARAREQGYDEAVLLNEHGSVSECASANLFAVRDGIAYTPPLSSGCLPGVTREVLLEIGGAGSAGVTREVLMETGAAGPPAVRERDLRLNDLLAADEVFMTSTTREVLPVASVDDQPIAAADGPVSRALAAAFSARVAADLLRGAASADRAAAPDR